MRKAKKDELEKIASFIVERFEGLEQSAFLYKDFENAKEVMKKVTTAELSLYFEKGDILIEGIDELDAILIAIKTTKYTLFNIILNSLKTQKYLRKVSKSDLVILKNKMKILNMIHDRCWFKKYSKNCYYITQIAVSKEKKGSGLFRKIITPILEKCEKNNTCIVLETFTKNNVSLYEHFGFELVETHTNDIVPFSEYCMIKYDYIRGKINMDKKQLLDLVEHLNLPKEEYYILGSGSLLLHGLRKEAKDLNLCVSTKLFEEIVTKFNIDLSAKKDDGFYPIDDLIEVIPNEKNMFTCSYKDGYPVESLERILEYKKFRNAPKDQSDIVNIEAYLNKDRI